ncbi:MAG: stage III sporulation protein AD [Clostridia bacterium]|nr:stage III sporulation protein AD [Clostridia bacterium]
MVKIIIIALICVFLSASLKNINSDFSMFINVAGGVIIFLLSIEKLVELIEGIKEIYNFSNINFNFVNVIFKILGISYVTEFTSDIADDFGNHSIASKVLLGGKLTVCAVAVPVVKDLFSILFSLV